ncbi:hypothetical protein RB195_023647 [Necator americanus]|uniref:Cdc42 binding domain-containing protein n=1 Tax=Necator americanus TaxID=51031 RepID=A0ABR1EK19_NECAM
MSDVSNSSAWKTLPEDEPPLCIAVRRPEWPPRHYDEVVAGSFIHAAHGDVLGKESWGSPKKIDDIYLNHPVVGDPIDTIVDIPDRVSNVTDVWKAGRTSLHCDASYPLSSKDGFKDDWDNTFDTAAFGGSFSPREINVPELATERRRTLLSVNSIEGSKQFASVSAISPNTSVFPKWENHRECIPVQTRDRMVDAAPSNTTSSDGMREHSAAVATYKETEQEYTEANEIGKIDRPIADQ